MVFRKLHATQEFKDYISLGSNKKEGLKVPKEITDSPKSLKVNLNKPNK